MYLQSWMADPLFRAAALECPECLEIIKHVEIFYGRGEDEWRVRSAYAVCVQGHRSSLTPLLPL